MGRIVIFGIADTAQLAHLYLTHDSDHEVVAFSVTNDYLPEEATFEGLPVVPFDTVESLYSPSDFLFFAPMNARRMNRVRASIFDQIKAKGYRMNQLRQLEGDRVFTDLSVGENCFILEDNTIQPYTPIGNNVCPLEWEPHRPSRRHQGPRVLQLARGALGTLHRRTLLLLRRQRDNSRLHARCGRLPDRHGSMHRGGYGALGRLHGMPGEETEGSQRGPGFLDGPS